MPADQPSDAGARREMERLVWAAAFAARYRQPCRDLGETSADSVQGAAEHADRVAAAYREHGPTR